MNVENSGHQEIKSEANGQQKEVIMATFTAGYAIVWVFLVFYVGWIAQRQRRLAARYEALQRQIEADDRCDSSISRAA